jgi:preprotein translocase subunit YajC
MGWLIPLYILIFLALIWYIGIRPQQKRRREMQELLGQLAIGDDIVTVGGVYGTVTEIEEGDTVLVEIAEEVDIRISKASIAKRLPAEADLPTEVGSAGSASSA